MRRTRQDPSAGFLRRVRPVRLGDPAVDGRTCRAAWPCCVWRVTAFFGCRRRARETARVTVVCDRPWLRIRKKCSPPPWTSGRAGVSLRRDAHGLGTLPSTVSCLTGAGRPTPSERCCSILLPWLPPQIAMTLDDTLCHKSGPHLFGTAMHYDAHASSCGREARRAARASSPSGATAWSPRSGCPFPHRARDDGRGTL